MKVHLNDHFTYKKLFRAVISPILMMLFTSLYTIVDGLFVSNVVGETPFAALNLVFPVTFAVGSVGFMLGTGGSALVSKTLGEGDRERANKLFSLIVYFTIIVGVILSVVGALVIEPVAKLLGATEDMLPYCVLYGRILLSAEIVFMLQNLFQSFFIAAEKSGLGFLICVIAGVTNMVLDAAFMVGAKLGLMGAALATIIAQAVGGTVPIFYFAFKNKSLLRLVPAKLEFKPIFKACTNGASEFLSNISMSIVTMLYNWQLLKIVGEQGVSAYGVIQYIGFIFAAILIGYSIGTAPIISYHFGAQNRDELKNLLRKSLIVNVVLGVLMTALSEGLATPLSMIFVSYDKTLLDMTVNGMRIYSISFLLTGINIFASSFFTALNNGRISALISVMRTLVLQIAAVMLLPLAFKLNGIWAAVIVVEGLSVIISAICLICERKRYGY